MKKPGWWLKRIGATLLVLAVLLLLPVLPRSTIPQIRPPPGSDSIRLAANKAYDINRLGEVLLGSQYRDLWRQEITVGVLALRDFEGGLRPVREGGGQETRSLHFESADGRHFIFRSVDKEVLRLLHTGLGKSPVAWLVHDQTSSSFPAGALVANPLQEAAGLASGHPRLVVLPDDSILGAYRERFAGVLGLLQDGPGDYVRTLPGAAEVSVVKPTDEVLPLADSSSLDRLDTHSFLTARLVDAFLNDWDRHEGQWRWAAIRESWGTRWLAIPVDRDQAFSSYDGVLMAIARLRTPKLAVFVSEYPSLRGLSRNSRSLDRRLLAGFERAAWDSTASFVVARLSDSVIEAAVRKLPAAYYQAAGARLASTLKQRRDRLREFAAKFYLQMAEHSEVHGTRQAETTHLIYNPDGGIEVRIATRVGDQEHRPWFFRRYLPAETERIDLHLGGGRDRIVVTGVPSRAIAVRVFDEMGRRVSMESLLDSTAVHP